MAVVSGSEPQLHTGFTVSKTFFLNLFSLRWLNFILSDVTIVLKSSVGKLYYKVNNSWDNLFYNILYCRYGLLGTIVVEFLDMILSI